MRILALVPSPYDTSPGQRFRLEDWEPLLRKMGVEIIFESFEDEELHKLLYQRGRLAKKAYLILRALKRRAAVLRMVRQFDAVYIFRETALLGPPVFERWLSRTGVPLVYDFDDAIFVPYISPSNSYLSLLKYPSKTRSICRLSSHVMVGNSYLADYARQYNANVSIVPTTIDTEEFTVSPSRPSSKPPIIVWTGSHSTIQHLDTLRGVLQRLARKHEFRLRVIGTEAYQLDGVDVESVIWRADTEVKDLRVGDIGIMPLPDDRWSRGKCGCKALQYMALGIPAICSPVGVNTEIIHDGINGFIADKEDEWIQKLSQLLMSGELRRRLGRAGRDTVVARYSTVVQAPRVYSILSSVAQMKKTDGKDLEGPPSTVLRNIR